MAANPEREPSIKEPEVVETRAEEIPEYVEKGGVQTVKSQFPYQVKDDSGKPLITTPQTKVVTVTLPSDPSSLQTKAKGSTDDASTWWSKFWLRIIKKAVHFGWKIVGRK